MSQAWMPLYIGDYLRDTSRLSTMQHGAYLLLIMDYWVNGNLPDDDDQLANIARVPRREWDKLKPAIERLFQPGWKHKRVEEELAKAAEISAARRNSASKRWGRPYAGGDANASSCAGANDMHRARVSPSPSPSPATTDPDGSAAAAKPPLPPDFRELCEKAAGKAYAKGFGKIAALVEAGVSIEERILPMIRTVAADLAKEGLNVSSWGYFATAIADETREPGPPAAATPELIWCAQDSPEFAKGNRARALRGEKPLNAIPVPSRGGAKGIFHEARDLAGVEGGQV